MCADVLALHRLGSNTIALVLLDRITAHCVRGVLACAMDGIVHNVRMM